VILGQIFSLELDQQIVELSSVRSEGQPAHVLVLTQEHIFLQRPYRLCRL